MTTIDRERLSGLMERERALFRERHNFRPGDTLKLRPRPDLVHLFDRQTGKRL